MVDLEPGKDLMLRSDGLPDLGGMPDKETAEMFGFTDKFDLLEIAAPAEDAPEVPELADSLVPFEVPDAESVEVEREFHLNGTEINGKTMAVALMVNMQHLVFRRDILDQLGIAVPANYDEVLAAAAVEHRDRDRSRARLRHGASRHDARLPAGARPHSQSQAAAPRA